MNKPSRTDDTLPHPTWNQSPPELAADLTTRQDLGILANLREQKNGTTRPLELEHATRAAQAPEEPVGVAPAAARRDGTGSGGGGHQPPPLPLLSRSWAVLVKFSKFIGPGFMISVAYIDPGNYATDVAAGAQTRFALLFVVLMANAFAIYLQSLSIKLGSVTGLNLAENCRANLPRWLTVCLYILSEAAIIATDMAEVIGTAIALNLLLRVPLVAGAVISLVDVFVILLFYRPDGSMPAVRAFELFVAAIVLGVVVLFCVELSLIRDSSVADVFRGYLPSAAVVENNGLYLSCGILGATVMPHSIFLGSGVVRSRLRHFDVQNGLAPAPDAGSDDDDGSSIKYRPSAAAIRHCLRYSIFELGFSLFTFALFVNSAILIVAGAALYGNTEAADADLFGIHSLLSDSIAPVAGTVFALALLLSGISAGIVCTMAGQMVSEGMLNWRLKPWLRRLLTRAISIVPSVVIAAAVGKEGLNTALAASQVVLSAILPFVTAPLIYFTARNRYMTVAASGNGDRAIGMRNHWAVTVLGFLVWLVIAVMNVALLVLVGMGKM